MDSSIDRIETLEKRVDALTHDNAVLSMVLLEIQRSAMAGLYATTAVLAPKKSAEIAAAMQDPGVRLIAAQSVISMIDVTLVGLAAAPPETTASLRRLRALVTTCFPEVEQPKPGAVN